MLTVASIYWVSLDVTDINLPVSFQEHTFGENCEYLLKQHFKHLFWVRKRTVSLRRFVGVPITNMFRLRNNEKEKKKK